MVIVRMHKCIIQLSFSITLSLMASHDVRSIFSEKMRVSYACISVSLHRLSCAYFNFQPDCRGISINSRCCANLYAPYSTLWALITPNSLATTTPALVSQFYRSSVLLVYYDFSIPGFLPLLRTNLTKMILLTTHLASLVIQACCTRANPFMVILITLSHD
jgi:hypothetical protein